MRPALDEYMQGMREETATQIKGLADDTVEICVKHTTNLMTKYDAIVKKMMTDATTRIETLEECFCPRVEADNAKSVESSGPMVCESGSLGSADASTTRDFHVASEQAIQPAPHPDADEYCRDTNSEPSSSEMMLPPANAGVLPMPGDTVRVHGTACHYNEKFALVVGLDSESDRYMVQFAADQDAVKIKLQNVQFPAECPNCMSEVTSSGCFSCGHGCSDAQH